MAELKPCPFCGEPDGEKITHRSRQFHIVSCASCGAHGPVPVLASGETAESVWNRRTNPQPVTPEGGEVEPLGWGVFAPSGYMEANTGSEDHAREKAARIGEGWTVAPIYRNPPVADAALQEAARYRWLRDDASRGQVDVFLDRRGTRLAADRVCDHGIELTEAALNQRGGGGNG